MKCRIESRIMARLSTLSSPKEHIPFGDYSWIAFILLLLFLLPLLHCAFAFGRRWVVGRVITINISVAAQRHWHFMHYRLRVDAHKRRAVLSCVVCPLFVSLVFPIHSLFGLFCPFITIVSLSLCLSYSLHFIFALIFSLILLALFFYLYMDEKKWRALHRQWSAAEREGQERARCRRTRCHCIRDYGRLVCHQWNGRHS